MNIKTIKNELQNILCRPSEDSHRKSIQAITHYLRESQKTSALATTDQHFKREETERLITYINKNNLWNCNINFNYFLSEGAEQKVFIENNTKVLKLNDTIYYASWVDYLENLLLNNYFFPDTAYELLGFYKSNDDVLYALVEQNYIEANQPTKLSLVKEFLVNNGFVNTKNNDYYHPELGIILEDLHDENVLTQNEILYFIDTVFYIKPEIFWK